MTARETMKALDKRVFVNKDGHKAFYDTAGIFYLTGFSVRMYTDEHGKRYPHCCGYIARDKNRKNARLIAAEYLEVLEG